MIVCSQQVCTACDSASNDANFATSCAYDTFLEYYTCEIGSENATECLENIADWTDRAAIEAACSSAGGGGSDTDGSGSDTDGTNGNNDGGSSIPIWVWIVIGVVLLALLLALGYYLYRRHQKKNTPVEDGEDESLLISVEPSGLEGMGDFARGSAAEDTAILRGVGVSSNAQLVSAPNLEFAPDDVDPRRQGTPHDRAAVVRTPGTPSAKPS